MISKYEEINIGREMNNFWQPQLLSLFLLTAILCCFAIVVYRRAIKQEKNKAPSGILLFAETYVMGVDNLFKDASDQKISKPAPYIFTLITFLGVGNLMGLLGFEAPITSYSVALSLGLISWIGIYVIGIYYQKLKYFKQFANPLNIIGSVTPLISLSFRIFGNIIGGSTIMYLIYAFTGYVWGFIPVIGQLNIIGGVLAPTFHGYFDIFGGIIQAYVFTLLTIVLWSLEAEVTEEKTKKVKN